MCVHCKREVPEPPLCPCFSKKPSPGRTGLIGPPATVWISNVDRTLYQLVPGIHENGATCFQYSTQIGFVWSIPTCEGCTCKQVAIRRGTKSLPFVDFLTELHKLDLKQKHLLMKKGNWELFAAGYVFWKDVVTPSRVMEFHEVMDIKGFSIPQMLVAGVSEKDAKAAWELVYTPERLEVDARRKEIIEKLGRSGISSEAIAKALAADLAKRGLTRKNTD
jgi:hypothetical protein